jgi:hypothetical protein
MYWQFPPMFLTYLLRMIKYLFSIALLMVPLSSVAACDGVRPETFKEFFHLFAERKSFATNRTIYPTYTLRHQYGVENGKEVDSVEKTVVSKLADAPYPTMNEFALKNGLQLSIQLEKAEEAIIKMEKPYTDFILTYHFVRREKCWFLHHIEDHSL